MNINFLLPIAVVGFSTAILLEKKTLDFIDPEMALVYKGFLYFIFSILLILGLKYKGNSVIGKKNKNYKRGLMLLLLAYSIMFLIGNLLYYKLLQETKELTKLSFLIIIFNTLIIFTLSYIFRGEKINKNILFGIILTLIGVYLNLLY
jgi:drug/metabolite transporter (DMT)-like permease